jgi:hypothetical protein
VLDVSAITAGAADLRVVQRGMWVNLYESDALPTAPALAQIRDAKVDAVLAALDWSGDFL